MARKKKRSFKVLWAIAVLVALPMGFNALSVFMQKRYTAEMRLMIDETTQTTAEMANPFQQFDDIQEAARPRSPQTQLDILTGTVVLEDALRMAQDRLPDKIKLEGRESVLYENLAKRLQVDNEVGSDILTIRVTDSDPEVAAELANDIGLSYIDYSKRMAREAGTLLSEQLKAKIDPLKAHLKRIYAAIGKIKAESSVYDIATAEANIGSTKEAADRTLANALAQYDGAKAQLVVSESEMKSIPEYVNSASHTQINPLAVSLEQSLAAERVQLAQLQAQYQDNFPTVREEKKKISDLERQLKSVKLNVESGEDRTLNPIYENQLTTVTSLRSQVEAYASQLAAAQVEQRRATASLGQIPIAEQKLEVLLQDKLVTEQTYQQLEQRQSMIQENGMARQPSSEIVSSALPPSGPSFPDHKMLTMAGLAIGVFCAVLILMPRPDLVLELPKEPEVSPSPLEGPENRKAAIPSPPPSVSTREELSPPPRTFVQAIRQATAPGMLTDEELAALALPPKKQGSSRESSSAV